MPQKTRKILVSNALPYANGDIHLGHLVGYIQADIWVRWQKMRGHLCLFVCGSDSHGTPIMIQAEKRGILPELMVEEFRQRHQQDFSDFLIEFDNFYTTHSPENQQFSEEIFVRHDKAGNITKRVIKQAYDAEKKIFLPDRYVKGECPSCGAKDQYGDSCEVCGATYAPTDLKNPYSVLSGTTPIEKESEHYFFKLQNYADMLGKWIKSGHLQEQVSNKLNEWFKEGLHEWDISRDAPYFGFKIPGETDKYFYCWLDAPIGYMASFKNLCSKRNDLNFAEFWNPESKTELYHFIGKDIIYFHALFWPAILFGAGYRTPTAVFANGFLTIQGQKMSKSRGTFINARDYLKHLNPEYLRYYFAAKLSNRMEDLDINFEDFMQRINADLVGKFVNIASRCAGFIHKYFAGKLAAELSEPALFAEFSAAEAELALKFENLEYNQAIRHIMALADRANQYIDEKKPWALAKNPEQLAEVQAVCSMGLNFFRLLMIYLKPVLPNTALKVEDFLNVAPLTWEDAKQPLLNHLIKPFQPLLTRIEPTQIAELQTIKPE